MWVNGGQKSLVPISWLVEMQYNAGGGPPAFLQCSQLQNPINDYQKPIFASNQQCEIFIIHEIHHWRTNISEPNRSLKFQQQKLPEKLRMVAPTLVEPYLNINPHQSTSINISINQRKSA